MGPKPKPIAIASGNQTRLDGFFTKTGRAEISTLPSSSTSSIPSKPSEVPEVRHKSVTSPKFISPSLRSPSPTIALPAKRPTEDADHYDGDSIELGRPPRKSPRASPEPFSVAGSFNHPRPVKSSSLSPLNSPTPEPSQPLSTVESTDSRAAFSHQTQPQNTHRQATSGRPLTSGSNKSTMTSSFASSRTSFPASSQRVVKNGQEMVRNSDSEGSDDSFADLDEMLDISRPMNTASSPLTDLSRTPTPPAEDRSSRLRRSTRVGKAATPHRASPNVEQPRNSLGMNLDSLLALNRKRDQENAKVAETMKAIEQFKNGPTSVSPGPDEERQVLAMIKESGREEDDADRLLDAISRTDSLVKTKHWSFFHYRQFKERQRKVQISRLDCGDHPSAAFLQDDETAKDILVSGYFVQVIRAAPLNTHLLEWLFQHALYDLRADVRSACVEALSSDGKVLSRDLYALVRSELEKLGMKDVAPGGKSCPVTGDRAPPLDLSGHEMNWTPLQQLLRILAVSAPAIGSKDSLDAICNLARMAIDSTIVSDFRNQSLLSEALDRWLEGLFENYPLMAEHDHSKSTSEVVLAALYELTTEDDFRVMILESLSQSRGTASLARRKLAMAWFYDNPTYLKRPVLPFSLQRKDQANLFVDIERIRKHMKENKFIFSINRQTDWAKLRPKMLLMTIAIGNGDPPVFADRDSREGLTDVRKEEVRKTVKRYNDEVDWFTRIISKMFSQVVDKGIEHITRTESKSLLERLSIRLSFCIRTVKPPRHRAFDKDPGNGNIKFHFETANKAAEKSAADAAPAQLTPPHEPVENCIVNTESAGAEADEQPIIPGEHKSPTFSARSPTSDYQDAPESINDVVMSPAAEEFHTAPESAPT